MFAIDGLANVSEPPPSRCPACQQTTSEEKCEGCGGPVFGLTARFREFVKHASTDKDRRTFANRLYDLRSAIAHRGELLREDEFDPGFTTGGGDSQWEYRDVGFTFTREVLRGWLCSHVVGPEPSRRQQR